MYLQKYAKYLEVDLIGSKATNRKQEKLSCLRQGLNPRPFSPVSSALLSEPSRLTLNLNFTEETTAIFNLVIDLGTLHTYPDLISH